MGVQKDKARAALEVAFRALAEVNAGKREWNFGLSIRFGPFEQFQQSDWRDFEATLREEIKANFISVKRDERNAIIQGSTGFTILKSKKYLCRENGVFVTMYLEEYIGFQTLRRMWKCTQGKFHLSFQKSSLDAICIAAGFDGILGALNNIKIGDMQVSRNDM